MAMTAKSRDGHSCADCEDVLEALIRPVRLDDDVEAVNGRINVGTLDSIIANDACSLCRLIARVFEQNRPDGWVQEGRIYCILNGGQPRVSAAGVRRDWAIELEIFYPDAEEEKQVEYLWRPFIQLLADDVKLLDGAADANADADADAECFQLGRLHSETPVDQVFIKECLRNCLKNHGAICEQSGKTFSLGDDELPAGMRLIDTTEFRIVPAPQKCSYVILSYVWGATNFLTLTKDTIEALTTKDVLRTTRVPKTIAHAIEATRMLNRRYLWVDALCILQDDLDEKLSQIQKMDVIYSKAMLTIVALDSTHADGGLWTASTKSGNKRQIVEEIGGLRFIGATPIIDVPLESSSWLSRAWTFQEFALSKRFLFFSDYQAYFSCETAACSEAYIERADAKGNIQLDHNEEQDPGAIVGRASNYQTNWPHLLKGYCRRALSFESDGLNAATGVLRSFANGIQDGFLCGLPVSSLFENSLLWFAGGPLRRRGPTVTGAPFPSWSWVGWVGPVSYETFEVSKAVRKCRIIHEWHIEYEGGTLASTSLHFPHGAGTLVSSLPEEDWSRANAVLPLIQTCVLCFEAKSAMFSIDDEFWNQFYETDDQDCKHTGLYMIFDKTVWIGSVHMEHATARALTTELHEFIVLSQSTDDIYPRQIDVRPHDVDADVVLLYDESLLEQHDWQVYNVMLITWQDGVARRRGIGQVLKASFEAAAWTTKAVRLA